MHCLKFVILLIALLSLNANAGCSDLNKESPDQLKGVLKLEVFPGRPNYSSVKEGDDPEETYILRLNTPICVAQHPHPFDRVHLVQMRQTRKKMKSLIGHHVQVQLAEQMQATTGHHHAPLVAWVLEIHRVRHNLTH